jgi:hypothetical protein
MLTSITTSTTFIVSVGVVDLVDCRRFGCCRRGEREASKQCDFSGYNDKAAPGTHAFSAALQASALVEYN